MNESGTTNPRYEVDSPPSDFNFDTMLPGRVFTMAGEEYLYLEDMGNGNHMIIRHESIRGINFTEQPQVLSNWFSGLDAEVQAMVQPVSIPAVVPLHWGLIYPWEGFRWLPAEWAATRFDAARADRTVVNSSGTPQAFALSFADIVHLSTPEGPFINGRAREGARNSWWWTRTPAAESILWWFVHGGPERPGQLHGQVTVDHMVNHGGVRPAIIIHQ